MLNPFLKQNNHQNIQLIQVNHNNNNNKSAVVNVEEPEVAVVSSSRAMLVVSLYPPDRGYTYCCYVPREADPEGPIVHQQSHLIPYSETYLLDCIDSQTIPLRLLTKLDKYDGINLLSYQNHVLCEVRDFRRFSTTGDFSNPVTRQIVLKPSNQSILSDLDNLIEKGFEDRQMHKRLLQATALTTGGKNGIINGEDTTDGCAPPLKRVKLENGVAGFAAEISKTLPSDDVLSLEQKLELEKEILRETAPPLCLDPSRTVGLIANQAQYERLKWNSEDLKRAVVSSCKRRERIKRAMERDDEDDDLENIVKDSECKNFMPFYRFVKKTVRQRQLNQLKDKKKIPKESLPELLRLPPINYLEFPIPLAAPTDMEDINKIGQPADPATLRPMFSENYVKKMEEYILETERRKRPHTTRLSIYQRNGCESYFGELEQESFIEPNGFSNNPTASVPGIRSSLYPQENLVPGTQVPASTKCQFELGSGFSVALYIQQFTDIFTEDGRRPCKITVRKVGQIGPEVRYVNAYETIIAPPPPVASAAAAAVGSPPQAVVAPPPSPATCAPPGKVVSMPSTVQVTSMPATGSVASSQPPVQIVHPQPRTVQQQIQSIQQVYTSLGPATMVSAPTTMTLTTNAPSAASANVNFNLNLNAARIVRQQLLTRPQIINVNLQQPQQPQQQHIIRQNTPQLIHSQLAQQQGIRISKQPTLATLLLTGINPKGGSKPITVAIQPQPQNSTGVVGTTGQMQTIQIGNAMDVHHGHQHVVHHQNPQQQQHHQPTSSPIMIMVSPAGGNSQNTISIPSSSSGVNQQGHGGSVSLNLNAISLDGLLSSVSNASNMSNFITTTRANSGRNTVQMPVGLGNQLNTLNILRLSNNTNTVTLQPQQHAALMRQGNIVMSHAGRVTTAPGAGQQGHTMMNMNATGILINSGTANNTAQHQGNRGAQNVNLSGQHLNIIQKAGPTRVQVQSPDGQDMDELSVPDLNSLLNVSSNGNSATFHSGSGGQSTARTIDGRGLNLDLNLNLNLNLSGQMTHGQGPSSASATATVTSGRDYGRNQGNSQTANGSAGGSGDGVDSFFNALSEAIGPELGHKLDGSSTPMGQSGHNNHSQGMVSSSISPSATKTSCSSSIITINDLLGSPPMMVSSSTNNISGAPIPSPLQMQLQSPQSPSISSILSPISPNVMSTPAATVPASLAYSTPRLSALLAGTPSADSTMITNLVDSPTSAGNNNTTARGGLLSSGSYGNLLDRLAASRTQPQINQRTGGNNLSPIATATPSVVLEHPVLAATLTQGPNPNLHIRQGLTRPSYRQIAPAPPPQQQQQQHQQQQQQQQQQQLINLLGLVSQNNSTQGTGGTTAQTTIRINSGKPSPGTSGNR